MTDGEIKIEDTKITEHKPVGDTDEYTPDEHSLPEIRTLRIFNPRKGNALSKAMAMQLSEEIKKADADTNIKAIVLRGLEGRPEDIKKEGETPRTTFCAGMNLLEAAQELERLEEEHNIHEAGISAADRKKRKQECIKGMAKYCQVFAELFDTMERCEKPIIGVAYGPSTPPKEGETVKETAAGVGTTLLVLCDQVIHGPHVQVSYPEKNAKLWPHISGPYFADRVGIQQALDCFKSGEPQKLMEALIKKQSPEEQRQRFDWFDPDEEKLGENIEAQVALRLKNLPKKWQRPVVSNETYAAQGNNENMTAGLTPLLRAGCSIIDMSAADLAGQMVEVGAAGIKEVLGRRKEKIEGKKVLGTQGAAGDLPSAGEQTFPTGNVQVSDTITTTQTAQGTVEGVLRNGEGGKRIASS